ncbi:MAG: hypothetical protein AAF585_05745 [Verrucomicrobiota bacterium]
MSSHELQNDLLRKISNQTKRAKEAEKDVERLKTLLDSSAAEIESFRQLPWWSLARWRAGLRLMRTGQTKPQRELAKKYQRWSEKHAESGHSHESADNLDSLSDAVREQQAEDEETKWANANDQIKTERNPVPANLEIVIYDLSNETDITLTRSEADLSDAIVAKPQTRFFDVFDQLDKQITQSMADYTLFLEAGAAMMRLPSELSGDVILPRVINLDNADLSPVYSRDELPKRALFSQQLPCMIVRNEWVRELGEPRLFHHFFHFAFWNLQLQVGADLVQLEEPSIIAPQREINLSYANRAWMKREMPNEIPELRDAQEEWDILKHDLVARVVQANLSHFQEQVTYLTAVNETGIRR